MSNDVLIVDDESDIRMLIAGVLEDEGYNTREAANSSLALDEVRKRKPGIIILDVWLKDSLLDGIGLLEQLVRDYEGLPVLMVSGHGTLDLAVRAVKLGANDFLSKPFTADVLLHAVERALRESHLARDKQKGVSYSSGDIVLSGKSVIAQQLNDQVEKMARSDCHLLLVGQAGTGKSSIARAIHEKSVRNLGPFVEVMCLQFSKDTLMRELFGQEGKASDSIKIGALEEAHGGSLLLRDVFKSPKEVQTLLAQTIQKKKFCRKGGNIEVEVNLRMIGTGDVDVNEDELDADISKDLYQRLAGGACISVASLYQRSEDIGGIFDQFMQQVSAQAGRIKRSFDQAAITSLMNHRWSKNLLEVENMVRNLIYNHQGSANMPVTSHELMQIMDKSADHAIDDTGAEKSDGDFNQLFGVSLREARESFEREYIRFQLRRFDGNITKTAKFAGMDRAALHRKAKVLGLLN